MADVSLPVINNGPVVSASLPQISASRMSAEHIDFNRYNQAVSTQTDMDVDFLPSLAREKSTLTDNILHRRGGTPNGMVDYSYDGPGVTQSYPEAPFNNYYSRLTNIGRQFAHKRMSRRFVEPGPPIFRSGRLGAPWRHIKQCTGNLGNHICFVDGTVKQDDARECPPYGLLPESHTYVSPRLQTAPMSPRRVQEGNSKFNTHARNNFKYWYEEKKPTSLHSKYSMGTVGNPVGIPGTALAPVF